MNRHGAQETRVNPSAASDLRALLHVERTLTARGEPHVKLLLCVKEMAAILDVGAIILREAVEEGRSLRLVTWAGWAVEGTPSQVIDVDRWFSGAAFKLARPIIVNDYPAHRLADQYWVAHGTRSLAALPVKGSQGPIGSMMLHSDQVGHFTLARVGFLTAAVGMIGLFLENQLLRTSSGAPLTLTPSNASSQSEAHGPDGSLTLDPIGRRVITRDAAIRLTGTEASLLSLLAANRGKVVTHQEILQAVWGPEYGVEREYVRVFVARLRKKLDQSKGGGWAIETIPRMGYRLK